MPVVVWATKSVAVSAVSNSSCKVRSWCRTEMRISVPAFRSVPYLRGG